MVRQMFRIVSLASVASAVVLMAWAAQSGSARAAGWIEKGIYLSGPNYDGDLPSCEAALGEITSRFESTQARFWNSNVQILGYERVREVAYSPWAKGTVPRRFCSAVADVSTGRKHVVNYYITEDGGMIGATWGVTYCVVGFDSNMVYSPACKMARP
ncbi:hypothetical protein [Undibacter mobilis]|uniref:Uncharacterized protein n=1 Tax=Undibacter mobilis TaxID=2292256 RepID=A0A371BBS4_9BRAD|nr:hypothetical protein [Undibacter mobilis]RDV04863.1 hypothetical protein DXH78_09985 [Undibacter mobilis]